MATPARLERATYGLGSLGSERFIEFSPLHSLGILDDPIKSGVSDCSGTVIEFLFSVPHVCPKNGAIGSKHMPSIKLTDRHIASASSSAGKRLDLFDQQVPGLRGISRVSDTGRKTFFFRYRTPDGRQPRYKLGTYPVLKLADARDAAIRLAGQITLGVDPATERRRNRDDAMSQEIHKFGELVNSYLLACEKGEWMPKGKLKRKRTLDDERAIYSRYVKSTLADIRLTEIKVSMVKKLLREMISRGIQAQTNRTQGFIRQVFNYAINEFDGELVTVNPALFKPLAVERPRTRVLNDAELSKFWGAAARTQSVSPSGYDKQKGSFLSSRPMRIILQLCLLLLLRESEVAGMQMNELDLDNATWRIPAERMKGGLPHLVPLPSIAVDLIREAVDSRRDGKSAYVFPSPRRNPAK